MYFCCVLFHVPVGSLSSLKISFQDPVAEDRCGVKGYCGAEEVRCFLFFIFIVYVHVCVYMFAYICMCVCVYIFSYFIL